MANQLFFTVRISTSHSNSILVHFLGWLIQSLQTLTNQWLRNYHISMLSPNILSSDSFFFQHQPFDTHQGKLHHTLTSQNRFLKQNKTLWEEPLCSRHFSITDPNLRSRWRPLQRDFTVFSFCQRFLRIRLCHHSKIMRRKLVLFIFLYLRISQMSQRYFQAFTQAVLLMFIFEKKIKFSNVLFHKKRSENYCKMQVAVRMCCKLHSGFIVEPWNKSRG